MEYTPVQRASFAERLDDFESTAELLLAYLCDSALDTPTTACEEDLFAIDYLEQLETRGATLFEPLVALDDKYERIEQFEGLWREFNAALPFHEAEFHWLLENSSELQSTDSEEATLWKLGQVEATIAVAGIGRRVNGRDLFERWVSWRRGSGAFATAGTLDVCRETLQSLLAVVT
jgi:hypothetical protein